MHSHVLAFPRVSHGTFPFLASCTTMALSVGILVIVLMLLAISKFKEHDLLRNVKKKLTSCFKRVFDNAGVATIAMEIIGAILTL
ncbi:MAG: hypothetical protein Q6373_004035 [Candidatus Sigynarchaeota archaeon]